MAPSKNLDTWTERLNDLNDERSQRIYSLMPKGKEGDAAELARIQASDDPKLVDINGKIADHVATRPQEDE